MRDCCLASLKLKMSPFSSVDAPLLNWELCQIISQVVFNTDSAYSYLWERTCVGIHVNTNWACWRRSLSMCGREERGTAEALKCWRHPLVAQANWVGETGLLSSSRGVCWWPSLGSLQKQEHKYQVQCFPFEKGSLILVPCQTLVIFDSEMCSFGYDFLSSLTMCPNVQICPSSMLHFNRGHILLLFYISNRSCWVEDILR